jgi:hypothetical protein
MIPNQTSSYRPVALLLAGFACILAAVLRFFPLQELWNLAPVGALALFAGARLRTWQALALPLTVRVLTDLLLPLRFPDYPLFDLSFLFVYASILLSVGLGMMLRRTENPWSIGGLALLSSVLFFLITNFGSWLELTNLYTADLAGLLQCYVAGILFYRGTFIGDMAFAVVLFGAHVWLTRTFFHAEQVQRLALAEGEVLDPPETHL